MHKTAVVVFLISAWPGLAFAQYKKQPMDPFPKPPRFEQKGWFFAPGFTHQLVRPGNEVETLSEAGDTITQTSLNPSGKFGLYVEGGRYRIINNMYFFRYLDYGLSYKYYRGTESYEDQRVVSDAQTTFNEGQNQFTDHYVSGFLNMSNVIPLNDKIFLQNSFGLLAEYSIIQNRDNTHGLRPPDYPPSFRTELNYKFGVGFKPNNWLLVIPGLQTSLLNLYPWDGFNFSLPYFGSRYKPIIFSLRFLFLNPVHPENCPPVDAINVPEGVEQQKQ